MSLTTIQAGDIAEYRGEAEPAFARLYANQQFTTDDGVVVAQGSARKPSFYQEFVAIRNGDFIHLLEGDAYATTNSNKPMSTCTLVVYDVNGRVLVTPYHRLRISHQPSPTTWAALEIFSAAVPMKYPPHYLTADAILALFNELDGLTEWGQIGGDIQDQTDLIMLLDELGSGGDEHLEGEASLAAAIAAIGANQADLYVKENLTVAANTTIPANVHLVIEDGAVITVNSGVTLTINSFRDPGNVKVFAGAGAVRFAKGAVDAYKTAWRAGSSGGDITAAINEGIANVALWQGGDVQINPGNWTTSGGHQLVSGISIVGSNVRGSSGADKGTFIKITSGVPMFRFDGGRYFITFKGLHLNGNQIASSVGIYGESNTDPPIASQGLVIEDCTIGGFEYCVQLTDIHPTSYGWQMANVEFKNCFLADGLTAIFHCDSPNMDSIHFDNCMINPSRRGIWAERVLNMGFNACNFSGRGSEFHGTKQVEGNTVVAPSGITANGNGSCTVTWPGVLAAPVTISVPLTTAHNTAAKIAVAFAKALEGNEQYLSHEFVFATEGDAVFIQALDSEVNVDAANFTIETGAATGITNSLTSFTETAGSLPTVGDHPAVELAGGAATFVNCVEEGFGTFVKAALGQVSFFGTLIQAAVKTTGAFRTTFVTSGCKIGPKLFQNDGTSGVYGGEVLTSMGDETFRTVYMGTSWKVVAGTKIVRRGNPLTQTEPMDGFVKFGSRVRFRQGVWNSGAGTDNPLVKITASDPLKNFLQLGYQFEDENEDAQNVFNFSRNIDGNLRIWSPPGAYSNGVVVDGALRSARSFNTTEIVVSGSGGTKTLYTNQTNRYKITPTGDILFQIGAFELGVFFQIAIITSGTTPRTISFGTGFDAIAPFTTSAVSGERHLFTFYVVDSTRVELVSDPRMATRDEVSDLVKTTQFAHHLNPGGLEGVIVVAERVECITGSQLIYTVPAGHIFIGGGTLLNPTAGAITSAQTIFNIGGSNYQTGAADASIASKDLETTGGVNGFGALPAGATVTQNAAASGLVVMLRGILIPTILNPRLKFFTHTITNVLSTVYATAADKKCVATQGFGAYGSFVDIPTVNNPIGSGGSTVVLSVRPTATPYNALLHDFRSRTVVDTAVTQFSTAPVIPPSHTVEVVSSVATAGQLLRILLLEVDA